METTMTLYTQREAASVLRLSERTLERWRVSGSSGLKFVRLPNRSIRYRQQDLDAYIAARVVGSTSEKGMVATMDERSFAAALDRCIERSKSPPPMLNAPTI